MKYLTRKEKYVIILTPTKRPNKLYMAYMLFNNIIISVVQINNPNNDL